MPRHFTAEDRSTIRTQLLESGLKRFTQYGLRGMRIEDLCKDIGISKGSFYAFFDHKEALFLAIADQRDALHKAEIRAFFETCDGHAADQVGILFDMMLEKALGDPLLALVSAPEDMAVLMRKMPAERMDHEEKKDVAFLIGFCQRLKSKGGAGPADPQDVAGLMGLLVCLVLQRSLMSDVQFTSASRLLREMFILKLAGQTL